MITKRAMALLAAADPYSVEAGLASCGAYDGAWGQFGSGLGQVGTTIKGGEGVVGAGKKIGSAKDVNGVAEGAQEGLKAVGGTVSGLKGTWDGAQKFFMSLGGTVKVPVIGVKGPGLPMYANTTPPNIDWSKIAQINVNSPQSFLNAVADYWLFYTPAWIQFGYKPPQPGGKAGQVWNPFKGAWQGGGVPIIDPDADKTKKNLPKYGTLTGEARIKAIQMNINQLAGYPATVGFKVAFAKQTLNVAAGNFLKANQGYLYKGPPKGDFTGIVSAIRILTEVQYVKTALAMNMTVTKGPKAAELFEHLRFQWLKDLTALVQSMPQAARPSNAGALGVATTDGTATGTPVVPTPSKGPPAVAVIGGLGLALFLMRMFA